MVTRTLLAAEDAGATAIGASPSFARTSGALAAETVRRTEITGANTPTAGVLHVTRINLNVGSYTTLRIAKSSTTGATLANAFFAIYDPDTLARLSVSANVAAGVEAISANTTGQVTLNTTITTAKDYWLGLLIGSAGTMSSFAGYTIFTTSLVNLAPPLVARHATTGLTAAPDPLNISVGASGQILPWFRYE